MPSIISIYLGNYLRVAICPDTSQVIIDSAHTDSLDKFKPIELEKNVANSTDRSKSSKILENVNSSDVKSITGSTNDEPKLVESPTPPVPEPPLPPLRATKVDFYLRWEDIKSDEAFKDTVKNKIKLSNKTNAFISGNSIGIIGFNYNKLEANLKDLMDEKKAVITRLNLSNSDLVEFPKELLDFQNLETLELAANSLKKIPGEIKNLESLIEIDLSFNSRLEKLPWKELVKLKNLKNPKLKRVYKLKAFSCRP